MRKFMIGAIVAAAAFSMAPASADESPCVVGPGEADVAGECSYIAAGAGTLVVLTPNSVSLRVTFEFEGETHVRQTISNSSADPAAQGTHAINSVAGDLVSLTVGPDCAYEPVCGHVGLVIAGDDN